MPDITEADKPLRLADAIYRDIPLCVRIVVSEG